MTFCDARTYGVHVGVTGAQGKALVDALRLERACDQVANPTVSFASDAREVGFSEASAFNRAYRRWTGQSPAQWRLSNGSQFTKHVGN